MKLYTKDQLIGEIHKIFEKGWYSSVKKTVDVRNDGAVGNTLEVLLGIKENNLPIPNAQEWELKGQRSHTSSLITLKHIEPSPRAARIVPQQLLPHYGWQHKQAGKKYPETEMSFRSTTSATKFTSRGFKIDVDRKQKKLRFVFDSNKVDTTNDELATWLESVERRVGLGLLDPEPYWGFEDLKYAIGDKIRNCFYVIADSKIEDKKEYFLYKGLSILSGFSFEKFLECVETGGVLVDFDARTGHNHGTKFRIQQKRFPELYTEVKQI
ncbi:MvaI/BcnI restriction endonuclease family protein [Patescibacteria group bacterium]|nr:MvaI/BcnI restriction endonuclease family protein [Patescibacteria group bacterium]